MSNRTTLPDYHTRSNVSFSIVTQCPEFVGNAQAPESCLRYGDTWCQLECKLGYIKTSQSTNTTKYCNKLGNWDDVPTDLCKGKHHFINFANAVSFCFCPGVEDFSVLVYFGFGLPVAYVRK